MDNFAQKLQAARKAAGLSQQGMADRTLIPKRTVEKWETGERTPPPYVQRFVLNELESLRREEGFSVQRDEALKAPPDPNVRAARIISILFMSFCFNTTYSE